jgi:membrane protein DedA with SNARE-associated domain
MTVSLWLAALGAIFGSLFKNIIVFLGAVKLGMERAERANLQKHVDRMQEAHDAEVAAKNSTDPDPFLRD